MTDSLINRRTMAKGAAWSMPLITTTALIPAYAASPGCYTMLWTAGNISGATGSRVFTGTATKPGSSTNINVQVTHCRLRRHHGRWSQTPRYRSRLYPLRFCGKLGRGTKSD